MGIFYKNLLEAEYERRKGRNASYSMRSFAKALRIDPGLLSKIFADKKVPTLAMAEKVSDVLGLEGAEKAKFIDSVAEARKSRLLASKGMATTESREVERIDNDTFETISKLYHNAILELLCTDDAPKDSRSIARRLGITKIEADQALTRLLRLGLVAMNSGQLSKTNKHLGTGDTSKTSPALKEQQREIFRSALRALDTQVIEKRSHTGITMAIDPAKLPIAKKMIDEFMFDLCEVLESGERKEVFQLGVGLFSLEKK